MSESPSVESQLGERRELGTRLPADPAAAVDASLVDELRRGDCYATCETPDYLAYAWFEDGAFEIEVWLRGQPQEVISAETLEEARESVDFFYGGEAPEG